MENAKQQEYTPGPWISDGGAHIQALYHPTDGGRPFYRTIARLDQPTVPPDQSSGNSRIMSAAVNYYEACKDLPQFIDGESSTDYDKRVLAWFYCNAGRINTANKKAEEKAV